MEFSKEIFIALGGFLIIALSANHISKFFAKIKFPLITGLLLAGILAGSLELAKEGNISIKQKNLFDDIFIKENK